MPVARVIDKACAINISCVISLACVIDVTCVINKLKLCLQQTAHKNGKE